MYEIEYRGILSTTKGVAVTRRPNIPAPRRRGEFVDVAGRDGSLFVTDDTYEDIDIPVPLNFVRAPKYWMETYRDVKNWITGSGKLKMGDDPGWFYNCKNAYITNPKRVVRVGGTIDAHFICDPYQYKEGGQFLLNPTEALLNPYAPTRPIYYIEGNGTCEIEVNGFAAEVEVDGNIIIDTNRMVAYTKTGDIVNRAFLAGAAFEAFWFKSGQNAAQVSNGFTLRIAPNWRSL